MNYGETVSTVDPNELLRVLNVNLVGAIRVVQTMLPLFERSGNPRIFFMSSDMGSNQMVRTYLPD